MPEPLTPDRPNANASARARRFGRTLRMAWYMPMLMGRGLPGVAAVVDADAARWAEITGLDVTPRRRVIALLATYPEFRTLYCYRVRRAGTVGGIVGTILRVVFPGERTLHLATSEIGPGLFIQHGFATIVAARSIGRDCWINQQVTIGFDRPGDRPVIGDRVSVFAGAKVLGAITVGDDARIGANAVVIEDVPARHTAVGIPARHIPLDQTRHGRAGDDS